MINSGLSSLVLSCIAKFCAPTTTARARTNAAQTHTNSVTQITWRVRDRVAGILIALFVPIRIIPDTLAERTHSDTNGPLISASIALSHKFRPDHLFLRPPSPLTPSNAPRIHLLRFAQFLHCRCRLRCSPLHCPNRVILHLGARLSPTRRYTRHLSPSSQDRHHRHSPATSC